MESIDKALNAVDEADTIKRAMEIEKFRKMMGEECLSEINKHVNNALKDIKNIEKISDGTYLLKVDIYELNVKNARKHFDEMYYFRFNTNYKNGIPHEIIKECIKLPDDLSIIKVDTHNMSGMYYNTGADICCTFSGFFTNLICCCLPFYCSNCNSITFRPNHIDMTLFIWFKKKI